MKKLLIPFFLFLAITNVWAVDTYNPANGQLTIPSVQVGNTLYSNVLVQLNAACSHRGDSS